MLVQMGLKRLILSLFASKASAAEGAAALASGLAQVYVNSFASAAAIPVTGWAMAPGIASANCRLPRLLEQPEPPLLVLASGPG